MIGTTLGVYRVGDKIGEGGMGEVYRGHDAALNRVVAIKVLPESLVADADRLARFQREARALAALNHPNIAQIYGLERSGARPAIVMEMVDGDTLAQTIRAGRIPIDQALEIARQIADALVAAHERGIVHRDLKPSNIKVNEDGVVKVLDFGLAKALGPGAEEAAASSTDAADSPTLTARATQLGMILGTAAYMAPEQAKGKPIDKRVDLWALGCVLFEMLAGVRAFEGEDVSDTLASVLKGTPDWSRLPAGTPPVVERLLRRCLEKDRKRRLADAADARFEIEEALASPADGGARPIAAPSRASRGTLTLVAASALVAGAALSGLAAWLAAPAPATAQPARFLAAALPHVEAIVAGNSQDVAITPDATHIVYSGPKFGGLVIRALDSLTATPIKGVGMQSYGPFVSPDGAWVGYNDQVDDTLKRVSILGGPPVLICEVGAAGVRGASWGEDDRIVFGTVIPSGLRRVTAAGGKPEVVSTPTPGTNHVWPEILPGGRYALFTITSVQSDTHQVAILDLETKQHEVLIPGASYARYAPSGHIVYGVSGALHAVAFDLASRQVRGRAVPVLDSVVTKLSGAANFAFAGNGALFYMAGAPQTLQRTLVWVDRATGREEPVGAPPRAYFYPRLSPDGTRVALDVRDEKNDIWIWHLARKTLTPLTFDDGLDRMPVWAPSPDNRLVFSSQRDGLASLYRQAADGSQGVERLTTAERDQFPMSWSPDGRHLVFVQSSGTSPSFDLMVIDVEAGGAPTALVASPSDEWNGEISPDGKWLAYQSNESGRAEVYVRPFPNVADARIQVSTEGGTRPLWRRDGRELYYFLGPGIIHAVAVQPGAAFKAGAPEVVVKGLYAAPQVGRVYDASADGRRFLLIKRGLNEDQGESRQLVVVLNWFEELTRLAPGR